MTQALVALCHSGVKIKNAPLENIAFKKIITIINDVKVGEKDGPYLLRTSVIDGSKGRSNENTHTTASVLIPDCDSTVNAVTGEVTEGAPCLQAVHENLKKAGIDHTPHASHSHGIKECRHGRV